MCTFNQVWLFATPWTVTTPGSSAHGILQARVLEWVASHSLLQGISLTKWSKPHFLHLLHWQADSLPLAPPGKPYNHPVLSHSVMSDSVTLWTVACQAPLSMGILQARILEWVAMPSSKDLPNPRIKPGLPHFKQVLYCLNHQGSPQILQWVAYTFSKGFSWPRNWTRVFCIAGGFFTAELPGKPTMWNCRRHAITFIGFLSTP